MTYSDKLIAFIKQLEGVAFNASRNGLSDEEIIEAFDNVLRAEKRALAHKKGR